jgi:hypothetical protein
MLRLVRRKGMVVTEFRESTKPELEPREPGEGSDGEMVQAGSWEQGHISVVDWICISSAKYWMCLKKPD